MDDIDDQDASERSEESVAGASPVASTIPSQHIQSVEETALQRSKTLVCYTGSIWNGRKHRWNNRFRQL